MLKEHHLYKFAEFTIDPVAKVLFRDGAPVQMTRKAVETLLVLVEHPGQVLTKDEIMSAVWPDRVVDEANLAQNIAVIRKALGAAKGSPAYIATFPGRGYRLEGPVTAAQVSAGPAVDHPAAPVIESAPAPPAKQTPRWPVIAIAALLIAVAVIGFMATRRPAGDSVASLPVIAATRLPGKEYQPAISPDGQSIAFLWLEESSSVPAVWMVKRGETSPRQVSERGRHYSSPAWSSDSRELAYLGVGTLGTDVLVSSVAGGGERLITTLTPPDYGFDNRLLDWSPDGKLLVVSHAPAPGRPPLLMLISVASGETQPLTHPVPEVAGDIDPRFSPDGKRVSFIRLLHRSRQEIFSVPVGGGEPVRMTRLGRRISSHDWLPDGKTILASSDHAGEFRLWRLPAERAQSTEPEPINIRGEFPIQLSVARNAEALVYSMLHQDRNIWRLDLVDRTWKRVIASTMQDASPVYSPSGDRIAFRSDRSGEEQLWIANADGSNPVRITHGNVKPSVGRWAPDGRTLVFNDPQTSDIYLVALESSGAVLKKTGATGVHPVFSMDGQWLFAGGAKLVRIPAAGGEAVTIADTRGEALSTSPDGKYLYFVREPNDTALWRVALSGDAEPEKVLEGLVPGCTSCWSLAPDGVYYLGAGGDSFDRQAVYFRSFDGKGASRLIAEYPQPLWPLGSGPFSLSPDRRYLLCVRVDPSNTDAMLVVPFR